jgi:hypothetical protein
MIIECKQPHRWNFDKSMLDEGELRIQHNGNLNIKIVIDDENYISSNREGSLDHGTFVMESILKTKKYYWNKSDDIVIHCRKPLKFLLIQCNKLMDSNISNVNKLSIIATNIDNCKFSNMRANIQVESMNNAYFYNVVNCLSIKVPGAYLEYINAGNINNCSFVNCKNLNIKGYFENTKIIDSIAKVSGSGEATVVDSDVVAADYMDGGIAWSVKLNYADIMV